MRSLAMYVYPAPIARQTFAVMARVSMIVRLSMGSRWIAGWLIALSSIVSTTTMPSLAQAQNGTAANLVPVISLLLDSKDRCLRLISVGEVDFDTLDPDCSSAGFPGRYAFYYSFTHLGGPLLIELISEFPDSYDAFVFLRFGEGRNGGFVFENGGTIVGANASDNDDHDDFRSSRMAFTALPEGKYTIEATSLNGSVEGAYNLSVYGNKVTAKATGRLNDTGISFSGTSGNTNDPDCSTATGNFSVQDCDRGRDADSVIGYPNSNGDGDGGFSFLKVASDGAPLAATASEWSCVKDNVTGLMWEVKTDDDSRHDKDHTYTWFNTNPSENGGSVGNPGSAPGSGTASCLGSLFCNTEAFVTSVNDAGLCGYNNWRMPTPGELQNLVNYQTIDFSNPTIDTEFFPYTTISPFWSGSPDIGNTLFAWFVSFVNSGASFSTRDTPLSVRLVHGGE